jgi:hypothetical protein
VPYDSGGKGLHFHGVPEEVSGRGIAPLAWDELIDDVRFWQIVLQKSFLSHRPQIFGL